MENNYFKLRNVTPDKYANAQLPYYFKNRLKGHEVILEFGCGFGQLLSSLKNEGFKDVYGYDINKSALQYCEKNNLRIFRNLKEINIEFDVVIMLHVLEHIDKTKIIETLKLIREKLLKKDGRLFISVPNAQANTGCYWRYEDWTHKTLFTSGSLFYVIKAAGFQNIEFIDIDNTENLNIFKKVIKKLILRIYILKINFWNKVTSSAYHAESPNIFSYEIRAVASD